MAVSDSRVLLLRHAPTPATRCSAFAADEPLDRPGREAAAALRHLTPDHVVSSPAQRCRGTVAAAGWSLDAVDPRWSELDFGAWAGRTYAQVAATDAASLAAWQADPLTVAPAGGETVTDLHDRTFAALAELHGRPGTTLVVTSGGPIKLVVLTALAAPLERLWNVAVAPLSCTELHARPDGGWTLVAGADATASTTSTVLA